MFLALKIYVIKAQGCGSQGKIMCKRKGHEAHVIVRTQVRVLCKRKDDNELT